MDQLNKDIIKLNQVFADDDDYQAHFTELNQNSFEITNCVRPYKTIVGRLNETNLFCGPGNLDRRGIMKRLRRTSVRKSSFD
jgi:hypothetical protein